MKLTLSQKREIVREFQRGAGAGTIATLMKARHELDIGHDDVLDALRDFMNGKFTLEPKGQKK